MKVIIYLLAIIGLLLIIYIAAVFFYYKIPMIWEKLRENGWRKKYLKLENRQPIAKCYCKFCKYFEFRYCEYYHNQRETLDFCSNAVPKIPPKEERKIK